MSHWAPRPAPSDHGRPELEPPTIRPRESNDLGQRITRIEEHLNWTAADRYRLHQESRRIESDSLNRDHDLAQSIHKANDSISRWLHKIRAAEAALTWAKSGLWWMAGLILIAVSFSQDGAAGALAFAAKVLAGVFGLPKP